MAKLLSGTRIYGTANADTSVYVGTSNNTTGTGGVLANNTVVLIGNNTINAQISAAALNINTHFIANTTGVYTTGTVNAVSYTVAAAFIANTTGVYTTGTVNAASHAAGATGAGTGGFIANVTTVFVGNNTINATHTSSGYTINGTTFIANTLGVYHTGVVNAAVHSVGSTFIANATQLTITIPFSANGGVGTAGQVLTSNGATGSPYWAAAAGGGGFTNGQSIMVSNLAYSNTANTARAYTFYNSNNNTLDTVFI